MEVHILKALKDNYIYVLHEPQTRTVAVVDPSESHPVMDFLEKNKWPLQMILNTHHHHDHVGGNLELKKRYGCEIFASTYDGQHHRVPGQTHSLRDGDLVRVGAESLRVLDVPGHTLGAIAYYSAGIKAAFTGDTLFTLGCGRLFEGTAQQLRNSLMKLSQLPDNTRIYCGHEYAHSNTAFALKINPQSLELKTRWEACLEARKKGPFAHQKSVPSLLGDEKRLNPFLTVAHLDEFTRIRKLRDEFRLEDFPGLG